MLPDSATLGHMRGMRDRGMNARTIAPGSGAGAGPVYADPAAQSEACPGPRAGVCKLLGMRPVTPSFKAAGTGHTALEEELL